MLDTASRDSGAIEWGEGAIKNDAGNTRANGVAVEDRRLTHERIASKRVM